MILVSAWFLANRHILLAIGDLQEIQIRRQKGKFGPKWSFAIASNDQVISGQFLRSCPEIPCTFRPRESSRG